MSIEAKFHHDLESILYIIFCICTGPGLVHLKSDIPQNGFPYLTWFREEMIEDIGYSELAHVQCFATAKLLDLLADWLDFAPFVKELIDACFPVKARLPNELGYEKILEILDKAYDAVQENVQRMWESWKLTEV